MQNRSMQKIIVEIKPTGGVGMLIIKGKKPVDCEDLTLNRDSDILFITALDKLLVRNKINRLSLKTLIIRGKMDNQALWGIILGAVLTALKL